MLKNKTHSHLLWWAELNLVVQGISILFPKFIDLKLKMRLGLPDWVMIVFADNHM
jgi:hypothetical protein